jgi:hypothetical protein
MMSTFFFRQKVSNQLITDASAFLVADRQKDMQLEVYLLNIDFCAFICWYVGSTRYMIKNWLFLYYLCVDCQDFRDSFHDLVTGRIRLKNNLPHMTVKLLLLNPSHHLY